MVLGNAVQHRPQQPGTDALPLTISPQLPEGAVLRGRRLNGEPAQLEGGALRTDLRVDRLLEVDYELAEAAALISAPRAP